MRKTLAVLTILVFVVTACGNSAPVQTETATVLPTRTAVIPTIAVPSPTPVSQGLPSGEIIYEIGPNSPNGGIYHFYSLILNQGQVKSNTLISQVNRAPDGSESRTAFDYQPFPDGKDVTFMTFDRGSSSDSGMQEDLALITFNRDQGYENPTSYVPIEGNWLGLYGHQYPGPVLLSDNTGDYQEYANIYQVVSPGSLPTLVWKVKNPMPTDKQCGNWDIIEPSPDGNAVLWEVSRFTGSCEIGVSSSTDDYAASTVLVSKDKGVLYTFEETHKPDGSLGTYYILMLWSPDGKRLLYEEVNTVDDTDCFYYIDVPPQSDKVTKLYCRDYVGGPAYSAVWSPDGSKIVMLSADYRKIYVMDIQTPGIVHDVLKSQDVPYIGSDTSIVWSPDSQWLAFGLDMGEGHAGIYAVRINGEDLMPLLINSEWSRSIFNMPRPYAWWTK